MSRGEVCGEFDDALAGAFGGENFDVIAELKELAHGFNIGVADREELTSAFT